MGWRGRQARLHSPKASPKQRVCLSILSFPRSEIGPHLGDRKATSPGAMVSRGPGGRVAARKVWSGLMGSNLLVEEAGSARVRSQRIAHAAKAGGDERPRVRIGRAPRAVSDPCCSQPGIRAPAQQSSGAEFCQRPGRDWTQFVLHGLLGRALWASSLVSEEPG